MGFHNDYKSKSKGTICISWAYRGSWGWQSPKECYLLQKSKRKIQRNIWFSNQTQSNLGKGLKTWLKKYQSIKANIKKYFFEYSIKSFLY